MKVWTVPLDYYATGEGRTLFGWLGHAENREEALTGFGKAFDPDFAIGAEVHEGVVDNPVVRLLFSRDALAQVRRLSGMATVELSGRLHFNLA